MTFTFKKEGNLIKLRTELQHSIEEEIQTTMEMLRDLDINNLLICFTEKGKLEGNMTVVGTSVPLLNWMLDCAKTDLQRIFNNEGDTECEVID